jgi:hypothetical protein
MAREGSKRQVAIDIMNANAKAPMAEVLELIAKANGIEVGAARSYYVYLVKQGMAKGKVEAAPKAEKAPKTAKEKTVKRLVKEATAKVKTKAEAIKAVSKTPEEIQAIKEANKARMKAVLAKTKQTVEAPAFAAEVDADAPVFLTKDEVSELVG